MKVAIGKNTLGDSNKMSVNLKEYGRSTHDLSYAWRSTMGVGTLVPFMKILALPGDEFDISLEQKVMTHPTVGPLMGSYKMQMDVFTCPIRLYNAMLHNNALNIGMKMSEVKLPKITAASEDTEYNPSSLLSYLGVKGQKAQQDINAVPIMAYYDIFKNYYANKQEENFYLITNGGEINSTTPDQGNTIIVRNKLVTNVNGSIVYTFSQDISTIEKSEIYIKFTETANGRTDTFSVSELESQRWTAQIASTKLTLTYEKMASKLNLPDGVYKTKATVKTSKEFLSALQLETIDDLREEILSRGRSQYTIGKGGNSTINWINRIQQYCEKNLGGLVLKTHMSDIFNNWVNTEWIDGENGISQITAVSVTDGKFTIDSLNLAQKVYNMLNRIAVSGGSYKDWIETVYTTDYYFRAETPVYEGGMSAMIDFGEVVSNSASTASGSDEPLGTLAGKGFSGQEKGGRLNIKVNEPCYIIGIVSITPIVDYSQQNDWDMTNLDTMDDLHKPQLDGIGYQDLKNSDLHWKGNDNAVGKTVAWIHYMTNWNRTYGNFAAGKNESFMVLNRIYNVDDTGELENATTYINPKDYTYIFAENDIDNMDFWVQIGCGIEARRVMSAKQIPLM